MGLFLKKMHRLQATCTKMKEESRELHSKLANIEVNVECLTTMYRTPTTYHTYTTRTYTTPTHHPHHTHTPHPYTRPTHHINIPRIYHTHTHYTHTRNTTPQHMEIMYLFSNKVAKYPARRSLGSKG